MFEPNHDPGVADGDDGEGNDVLHNVPCDVVIILLKERETFVYALDVPIIVLYEIKKYWIIQLNNDCKEVQFRLQWISLHRASPRTQRLTRRM